MGLGDWWAQHVSGSGPDKAAYDAAGAAASQGLGQSTALATQAANPAMFNQANGFTSRGNQGLDMLSQQAQGQGPSAAQVGANNALSAANNQIMSAAATRQSGIAPGLANRNMLASQAQAAGQIGQGAALGRAQEGMNAINQFGQQSAQLGAVSGNTAANQGRLQLGAAGLVSNNTQQGYQNALDYERQRAGTAHQGYEDLGNGFKGLSSLAMGS